MQNKTGKLHELQGKIEQIIELEESSRRDYLSMSNRYRMKFHKWMMADKERKLFLPKCVSVEHHDIEIQRKWACMEEIN
jgi:hypothetical protein